MDTPRWLTRASVSAMHSEQLREHGGLAGLRDDNALEAALARPRNRWAYGNSPDLAELAAGYGFGLASAHAFNDGNKRTAFLATYTFLGLAGPAPDAPETEVVEIMLDLAAGKTSEEAFAQWIRDRVLGVSPR